MAPPAPSPDARYGTAPALRPPVLATHGAYLLLGLAGNLIGPALPLLRTFLRQEYAGLALLFPAGAAGSVLSLVLGNRILDRVGYHRTLTAGAALYACALLSLGVTRLLSLWLVELFAAGFAASLIDMGCARFVTQAHPDGRNRALNLLNVYYAVGSLVGPGAVSLIASNHLPIADLLLAVGTIAALLTAATARTFAHASAFDQSALTPTLLDGWQWAARQRWLLKLCLAIALYVGAEVALAGWVSAYAHVTSGVPLGQAALFPLVFWAAMAAGRTLATERARHVSEESLLRFGLGVSLAGSLLLVVPGSVSLLVLGSILTGAGFGPLFPTLVSLAARRDPLHASESFAFLFPAGAAGNFLLPLLSGEFFARVSPVLAMAVPGLATVGVALAFAAFLREPPEPIGVHALR